MTQQHTRHLPKSTALFGIGIAGFGLAETQLRLCSAIVAVSDIAGLERLR